MRPLGAIVFGHIEDRYGRRRTMLLSMALMTVATLLGGLASYTAQLPTDRSGWPLVPGTPIAAVALCVLPMLLILSETNPARLGARRAPPRV